MGQGKAPSIPLAGPYHWRQGWAAEMSVAAAVLRELESLCQAAWLGQFSAEKGEPTCLPACLPTLPPVTKQVNQPNMGRAKDDVKELLVPGAHKAEA